LYLIVTPPAESSRVVVQAAPPPAPTSKPDSSRSGPPARRKRVRSAFRLRPAKLAPAGIMDPREPAWAPGNQSIPPAASGTRGLGPAPAKPWPDETRVRRGFQPSFPDREPVTCRSATSLIAWFPSSILQVSPRLMTGSVVPSRAWGPAGPATLADRPWRARPPSTGGPREQGASFGQARGYSLTRQGGPRVNDRRARRVTVGPSRPSRESSFDRERRQGWRVISGQQPAPGHQRLVTRPRSPPRPDLDPWPDHLVVEAGQGQGRAGWDALDQQARTGWGKAPERDGQASRATQAPPRRPSGGPRFDDDSRIPLPPSHPRVGPPLRGAPTCIPRTGNTDIFPGGPPGAAPADSFVAFLVAMDERKPRPKEPWGGVVR